MAWLRLLEITALSVQAAAQSLWSVTIFVDRCTIFVVSDHLLLA
jgi:hypothetical protein